MKNAMPATALIVEDEIFVALDLERILVDAGYAVKAIAADGDWLYGMDVCVDPDYRGLRIGQRLYNERRRLCEHLRLKGHIIAKGYMFPISLVVVGLSLILFPLAGIEMNILNTIKVLLVNLAVWGIIIVMIREAYIRVLHYSIKKRRVQRRRHPDVRC